MHNWKGPETYWEGITSYFLERLLFGDPEMTQDSLKLFASDMHLCSCTKQMQTHTHPYRVFNLDL